MQQHNASTMEALQQRNALQLATSNCNNATTTTKLLLQKRRKLYIYICGRRGKMKVKDVLRFRAR
jgi:hypothetical protein